MNDDDAERMKMGGNDEQQQKSAEENCVRIAKELPVIFGDFTIQESWNNFFAVRGGEDGYSEWYADWPQLQTLLRNHLSSPPPPEELRILVPACGYSRLSEHLYDDGFVNITNVDFSKLVISAMLRRNVKERPQMKWRVMDMTDMQFENGTFDAIIDKGALDALIELELGPRQGILYLSEVKRLLKAGGKYICLISAESHVLGLLFPKFRFGWKVNLYAITQEPSSGTTKQLTFMLVAEKYILTVVSQIISFVDECSAESHGNQVQELFGALERENNVRAEYSSGTAKWYSLEDLKQGVEGNLGVLDPGRAIRLFLGEPGVSRFFYNAVLLDAHPTTEPFSDQFLLLFFQRMQTFQRVLVSAHRPWLLIASSKAARLLMVLLDSSHSGATTRVIMKDIYHFLKQLDPVDNNDDIVVTPPGDRFKQQKIVYEVTSALTGRIVVDDVIYNSPPSDVPKTHDQSKDSIFRRLRFERTETFARAEALISAEGPNRIASEVERKNVPTSSRNLKRGKLRKFDSQSSDSPASSGDRKIDYKYLVSEFYKGMISGILLFSIRSKRTSAAGGLVKTVIIGLGAGLLPMSIRNYIPSLKIEVIELDPVVLNVAKEYFGFEENEHLKVHITDATKFVKDRANSEAEGNDSSKVDVLIIDVDSSDSSSGLISPEAEFVEEPFLLAAKESLSDKGLFLVKLVTNFPGVRGAVYSKLTTVFSNLFYIDLDTNFCELILALKKDSPVVGENELAEACAALERSLEYKNKDWVKRALDDSKLIKPIRRQ